MIEFLAQSALFGGCTLQQLDAVAKRCERRAFEAGTVVFAAQTPAEHLYVVERGSIELHFPLVCYGATQEVTVDRKLRGDALGWSSLVGGHTYTLSATATSEAALLRIRCDDLESLFVDRQFGYVVMRRLAEVIAQRFSVLEQMFIEMLQDRVVP